MQQPEVIQPLPLVERLSVDVSSILLALRLSSNRHLARMRAQF
jgi:hypothetical protein